jgi:hypothetical protein
MTQIGKKVLSFMQENFKEDEERELSDFINENIDGLLEYCDIKEDNRDRFIDDFCYNVSSKFEDFAKELIEYNTEEFSRVNIRFRNGFYYISLSDYANNSDCALVNEYVSKLDDLCVSERKDKGLLYEKFCQKWMQEYCEEVNLTPKSNDKGIDLVGKITANTSFDKIKNIEIQVLVQVKLNKNKSDTPVIRHLIGDSIFLSFAKDTCSIFKPTLLCVISHRGFSKGAISFANENHIFLLDSKKMIRVLEKKGHLKNFECIKYLDDMEI